MKRRRVDALDLGYKAAITSPTKHEAEFHAKANSCMNKILDIAQATVHVAASAEETKRVAELERANDAGEQRLGALEEQLADKLTKVDALLAKMEELSKWIQQLVRKKMLKKHTPVGLLHLTVTSSGARSPKKAHAVVRVEPASSTLGIESFITSA